MNLRIGVSGQAEMDLTLQYRWYVENAEVEVAERFLTAFDLTTGKLSRLPGLGRLRRFKAPELAGMRSYPVSRSFSVHLIFYRNTGDAVSIERVMHGARDLPQRLLDPPGFEIL